MTFSSVIYIMALTALFGIKKRIPPACKLGKKFKKIFSVSVNLACFYVLIPSPQNEDFYSSGLKGKNGWLCL